MVGPWPLSPMVAMALVAEEAKENSEASAYEYVQYSGYARTRDGKMTKFFGPARPVVPFSGPARPGP